MKIRWIISLLLFFPAFFLAMRFHLHMFQLNGYKNGEHLRWLKKNCRRHWLLLLCLPLGCVQLFYRNIFTDIIGYLALLLTALVYYAYKKHYVKKKLVYTARAKRLIAAQAAVAVLAAAACCILGGPDLLCGVCLLLVFWQFFGIVVSNVINYPLEAAVRRYYINDARKKLREAPELCIVGITGSYGKTSMKFYLQTLLQEKYQVLVTPESFNTPMGVVRTIRESLRSTHEIFLCEMGARHVGDIKELCDIVHPRHGVITSVGPQHLETFFSMENIKNTKFELADALPSHGILFLNGDNEYIMEKAGEYENKVFYHSEKTGEGYSARDIRVSRLGTEFTVVAPGGETEAFQMRLVGIHNVINVVGAIAVANTLGIPLRDLRIPVRRIQPVEHRMQMIDRGAVTLIDDAYNSNPVGSRAAVETLAMFEGVRILITPGMVELGEEEEAYNYKFGSYAADCCDYILLVGKNHTGPIREGALDKGFPAERCLPFDSLEEALAYAYAIRGGDHKYILLENDLPDNY